MSHAAKGWSRLGRDAVERRNLLKTMVTQLVAHERIETTLPKAKAVARFAEKQVTLVKKGSPHLIEKACKFLNSEETGRKLVEEIAPRYQYREGGYTRVLRSRIRAGDNATMAFVEFVDREGELRPSKVPPLWKKAQESESVKNSTESSSVEQ